MPKRKKRGVQKKKKDDSPSDVSEGESIDRLPSSKKVAAASSTSHLEDEVDHISSFTSISLLNSNKSESGDIAALSSSHFFCNYCEFSAESKSVLLAHMRQHMIKCSHCSFSSLSRIEVSRHCKHEHEEDPEGVSQEVDSSSADCEMDKDPCTACVFCSFMTYSTEHLEKHTLHKHPGMLAKSVARMITKQNSMEVRRDDALFYLSISNDGLAKSSSYNLIASEKSSSPIVIDPIVNKTEDVKPEVKGTLYTKSSLHSSEQTGQLKTQTYSDYRSDTNAGENMINRSIKGKTEGSSGIPMLVKVETMYCLTCPYSSVYIEKLKCHTVVQHPVGAAAATFNSTGVDAEDITFFCVKEDCNHSSSDCTSYQNHLMNCCSYQKTMKVIEKERLKSTITYILEHQRKYKLPAADGFFDFASAFCDVSLPPALTGISSSASEEAQSIHHRRTERSLNVSHGPGVNAVKTSVESSPLPTDLYKTPSHLSSTAVSSSGSPSTESNSSNASQFFPQQVQNMTQNIHSTANSSDYQSQMMHNSVILPAQTDCFSRNMPTDGRSVQPVQSHSVVFYPQSQGNYPQPPSANSLVTSYSDTSQATVSWQTGQIQAASMPSVPVQSEQIYSNAFSTQNLDLNASGLRMQNSAAFNPLSLSRSDSFSVGHSSEMNQNFVPAASHNYAPSPGQVSQTPGNGSNLHIINSSFPGQSSETSANSVSNVMISSDAMAVSNSLTGNVFYGQQNPVSNVLNTTNLDQSSIETQPQPKMVDLLSDSYSILLSNEFGPDGQIQQVTDNNSFIQTQQTTVCPPSYQPEATLTTQNQAVVSQQPLAVTLQGQAVPYQPMQHEASRFQQMAVDNSQLPDCGNQFSFPVPNQNYQVTSMASSLGTNSSFQTAQNSSNCGALQHTVSTEESSVGQPAPYQSSEVPNFLVSPGNPPSEMVPHSVPSFNKRHSSTGQTSIGHPGTFTPSKNSNQSNKFASASPLSPSIYLSGQVPRHRRSNWTDADMSPRGLMLSGMPPRHVHPPVPAPGSHNYMNQRHSVPGRRGYSRGPRMSSGRGRMPAPRMPNNQIGGGGDDDDVILTAVVRGTPPKNQQSHQPPGGRVAYRGVPNPAPRGRGQVLPVQNRQRIQNSSPRVPYPVAPPPPLTHKQFDISKHFEDLACVVNATADEADGGGDDIQIVAVTPGKDKDKGNQPKAVDASKFSFCCVHCGKDQGSKTIMKLHMKARHNDSLLGAFTNTETGQLLFFCPQLNCEFMTYDEKRLSEHLPKCFDLDRSKPFDFGTAIKNLKSLKIRQLDVRTMGRSQDYPIDLDGQGMKDNFSSSLNDAFGDIVVNASGRHMLRNAAFHQTRPSQQQSVPAQSGTMQSKAPVRSLFPSNIATRLGHPRLPQQGNIGNRMLRPMAPFRYTKQQSYEMRPHLRQTGPANTPMDARNMRDMRPRAPSPAVHRQPMQMRAALPSVTTPRMPNRGQQDIVIVIDVDSPERPEEVQQNEPMITESPEVINQLPVVSSAQSSSSGLVETLPLNSVGCSESTNVSPYQEHQSMSDNPYLPPGHSASASPDLNPDSRLSHDDSGLSRTHASQLSSLSDQPVSYSYDRSLTPDEAPESDEDHLQQNSGTLSGTMSTHSNSSTQNSSQQDEPDSEYIPERSTVDSEAAVSDRIMGKSTPCSTKFVPTSSYTPVESSDVKSQITEHETNSSHGVPTYPSTSSVTSIPPTSIYSSTEPAGDYFDEEEKVNALVLEKVFAKVPNMPKNLSRRLVAKFKEYAKHRGVKITTDSKVIDEFVSKIYYKGSAGDKAASRPQQAPDASRFQPVGPQQASQFASDGPPQDSQFQPAESQQTSQLDSHGSPQTSQFEPAGSQRASQFESNGPSQVSQFQPVGSQQASQYESHGPPQTSQFQPAGSQQASQLDPDRPPQTSQFQPVGSQQASQYESDRPPQTSQFQPVGSQQASQYESDRPPQTSQFQPAGSQQASQLDPDRPPQTSQFQPVGSQQASQYESDRPPQTSQFQPVGSQQASQYVSHGPPQASQYVSHGPPQASQFQPAGSQQASQYESDGPPQASQFELSGTPQVATPTALAPAVSSSCVPSSESIEPPHNEIDYKSPQEYHDRSTDMVQKDPQKEHLQEEMTTLADPSFSEEASANDVVATQVILAERTLHFSPMFASIARKSSAASAQMLENAQDQDVGQRTVETNQHARAEFNDSVQKSAVNTESTTVLSRRNSLSDRPSRPVTNLRRSGSLSQIVSSVPGSSGATILSPEQHLKMETSSSPMNTSSSTMNTSSSPMNTSDVIGSPENTSGLDPTEDCGEDALEPATETLQEQKNLAVICNEQFKEEVEISFPPVSDSETAPILITSSVADIVSGHPGLEVDIAGKPLKQELLDEDNRDMNDVDENEDNFNKSPKNRAPSPKEMFEKVTPKSSIIIDRKTGKLSLKKTKRGRPRKLFTEKEEKKEEESKIVEAEEEHIVRRSSRSRKPVNKDYRSDANEIDELMSDDDDEYLIDEDDDDTDTDGDWRGGDSEQPPKKRIKKVVPPPDPTAFDISTKGKFKCWLCKKMFSRCTFAKSHIIQKHKEGLCAVYMDKSEESKTLSLLVFCPRKCRYVTLSIEGLMNHVEDCAETELEADGKPYLDINKGFLDNKYKELQGMTLEAVLSIPRARKPKDPTKSPKVKKSLSMNKSAAAAPVVIHHSDASVTIQADGIIPSTVAASSLSGSVPVVASPVPLQTATSHRLSLSGNSSMVASPVPLQTATSHRSTLSGSVPVVASSVPLQTATSHRLSLSGNASMVASPVPLQTATSHRSTLSGSVPVVASTVPLQTATSLRLSLSSNASMVASPVPLQTATSHRSSLSSSVPMVTSPVPLQTATSHRSSLSSSVPMVMSPVPLQTATSHRSSLSSSVPKVTSPVPLQTATSHRLSLSGNASMVASPVPLQTTISHHSSLSSNALMAASSAALHTAPSHRSNIAVHGQAYQQPAVRSPTATDYNTSVTSRQHFFHPHKPTQHNSPQVPGQYPSSVAMDMTNPHFHHTTSNAGSSASAVSAAYKHPPGQQMSITSEQIQANTSFPQSAQPRASSTSASPDQEDDIVYMIEDNGTICLK